MKKSAILWDYDGTLVNSVPKNIAITQQILLEVAPRLTGDNLPDYLKNEKLYHIANHQSKNWQDLYLNYYKMTEKEMLRAGALWTKYQLENRTAVELFPGIKESINQIELPMGICSQNSSENIYQLLKQNNIHDKFTSVIGYDDIPANAQKPNPFSGLKCLEQIFKDTRGKLIFYIGDHEGDVQFAKNMELELGGKSKVLTVIVKYSGADTSSWIYQPDFEINNPLDLLKIIKDHC